MGARPSRLQSCRSRCLRPLRCRHRGATDLFTWAQKNKEGRALFTLKYQQELAGFEVAREDLVITPMEVHRQLQVQYQRLQMQGLQHDKIMATLNDLCGLPVAWKVRRPGYIGLQPEHIGLHPPRGVEGASHAASTVAPAVSRKP